MANSDALNSAFLTKASFVVACGAFSLVAISAIWSNSRLSAAASQNTVAEIPIRPQARRRRAVDSLYVVDDHGAGITTKVSELIALSICLSRDLNLEEQVDYDVSEETLKLTSLLCRIQQVLSTAAGADAGWHACLKATTSALNDSLVTLSTAIKESNATVLMLEKIATQLKAQRPVLELLIEQAGSFPNSDQGSSGAAKALQAPAFQEEHIGITPGLDEQCWIDPPPYSPPTSSSSDTGWWASEKPGSPKQDVRPINADDIIHAVYANDSENLADLLSDGADASVVFGELQRTPLHVAAHLNHCACLAVLLKHGALMSTEDSKGDTALHLAAWAGHVEALSVLLSYGSEVDSLSGRDGYSPLWCAISAYQTDAARLLLKNGANVSLKAASGGGLTPLHQAAVTGQSAMCEMLLDKGAPVDASDDDQNTPLHYAAASGSRASVKVLLRNGASVEARQNFGLTAIHWAAHKGHTEVAALLLDHGSEIDGVASEGATALHLASNRGHAATVRLLLERGANRRPGVATWDGVVGTPVEMARAKGHNRLVRLLRA